MSSLITLPSSVVATDLLPKNKGDRVPRRTGDLGTTPPLSVKVVHQPDELESYLAEWEKLAAAALEPNVFHEPWMLLPAWRSFGKDVDLRCVLVHGPDPARLQGPPILYGLFPLARSKYCKGLPLSVLSIWRHVHSYLGTPLIRRGLGRETFSCLFDWLKHDPQGAAVLEMPTCAADGPVYQALMEVQNERHLLSYVEDAYYRAIVRRGPDAEAVIGLAMSGSHRKEMRRQRKRLGEQGRLETRALYATDDLSPWLEQFLGLEAAGWKGQEGTALATLPEQRRYFEEIAHAAHARGRLMLIGLFLDDQPLALKCNFMAGEGSFAFKIAFDERFARQSPGVLLEIDNVHALHDRPDWQWMDSCAKHNHFMINRLWSGRRSIITPLIGTGRAPGDLVVSTLPLLRWLKRTLSRHHAPVPTSK